uniref:Acetyltransf_13 domain-containing protein n=1 Tax=Macrostomum lignano TaxID=282301 RepID=A0A1I8FW91_9PLAT
MATTAKHSAATAGMRDAASPRHPMTSPRQSQVMQQQQAPFLESPQRSAPPVSTSATSGPGFHLPAHLRQLGQPVSPGETPVRRSHGGHPSMLASAGAAAPAAASSGVAPAATAGHEIEIRDWSLEDSRMRELEEARTRAAQMEKTMRWWSDCTASWRDKWAKTRNERNKSREEAQQLRQALEQTRRELEAVRRDRDGLLATISNSPAVGGQMPTVQLQPMSLPALTPTSSRVARCGPKSPGRQPAGLEDDANPSAGADSGKPADDQAVDKPDTADSQSAASLDELAKRLQIEQAERARLERAVAALHSELAAASSARSRGRRPRSGCDDEDEDEAEDEEEFGYRSNGKAANSASAARIEELQREVERLLAINASEWSHRERLQAQLGATEREARRLRQELADQRVPAVAAAAVTAVSADEADCEAAIDAALEDQELPTVKRQSQLSQQQRQLKQRAQETGGGEADGAAMPQQRHGSSKRLLCHVGEQLASTQYAAETADLRNRIDQLKELLAAAEDQLDAANRTARRLRMANADLAARASQLAADGCSSPEDALELACCVGDPVSSSGALDGVVNFGSSAGDRRSLPTNLISGDLPQAHGTDGGSADNQSNGFPGELATLSHKRCWRLWVLAPLVLAPLVRLWCWRLWCSGAGASGAGASGAGASGAGASGAGASGAGALLAPLVLAPLAGLWCWRLCKVVMHSSRSQRALSTHGKMTRRRMQLEQRTRRSSTTGRSRSPGLESCNQCGMIYSAARSSDVQKHLRFHSNRLDACVDYNKNLWRERQPIVKAFFNGDRIVRIGNDYRPSAAELAAVRLMRRDLAGVGAGDLEDDNDVTCWREAGLPDRLALMFVRPGCGIVGCCLVEPIRRAYRIALPGGNDKNAGTRNAISNGIALEMLVPEVALEMLVPEVALEMLVPEVALEMLVPEVALEMLVPEVALEMLAPEVALEMLVPEVALEMLVPEVALEMLVPEVSTETSMSETILVPASCGIYQIWCRSDQRRTGVATALLDAARQALCPGLLPDRKRVAFCSPSPSGYLLARDYVGGDEPPAMVGLATGSVLFSGGLGLSRRQTNCNVQSKPPIKKNVRGGGLNSNVLSSMVAMTGVTTARGLTASRRSRGDSQPENDQVVQELDNLAGGEHGHAQVDAQNSAQVGHEALQAVSSSEDDPVRSRLLNGDLHLQHVGPELSVVAFADCSVQLTSAANSGLTSKCRLPDMGLSKQKYRSGYWNGTSSTRRFVVTSFAWRRIMKPTSWRMKKPQQISQAISHRTLVYSRFSVTRRASAPKDRPALLADPNRLIQLWQRKDRLALLADPTRATKLKIPKDLPAPLGTASSEPKGPAKSGRSDEAQRARLERKRAKQRAKRQAKKGAAGAKAAASTMDAEATGVPRQPDGPAGGSSGSSAAALPGDAAAAAEAETTAQQMATANKEVPSGATFAAKAKAKIPGVIIQGRDQDWTTDQLQKVWSAVDSYLIELTVEEGISIGIERMVLRSTFVLIAPSSEEDARQLLQRLPTVSLDADLGGALFLREGQRPKTIPYVVFVPAKSTAAGPDVIRRVLLRLNPDLPASGLVYHRKVRRGETGNSIVLGLSSTWASRYPNGSSFQLGALKLKMRRGKSAKGKATANPGISGKSGAQSKAQGKAQADPKAKAASRPSASSSSATAVTAPAKPREPNLPVGEGVEDEAGSSESELSSATLVGSEGKDAGEEASSILSSEPEDSAGGPVGHCVSASVNLMKIAELYRPGLILIQEPWMRNGKLPNIPSGYSDFYELTDLRPIETCEDVDHMAETLTGCIIEAYEAACPARAYKGKTSAPWWNPELGKLRRKAKSLHRRAMKTGNPEDMELFRQASRNFKSEVRKAKECGVLTPTLWNLVMDALLSDSRPDPVFKVGYADDVTAIVAGPSPSTLRDLMQSFIRKAESWANDNGLELSEPKTVAIMGEAARTTRRLIDAGVKFIYMRAPAKRNLVPHSDLCLNFLNECQANRVFTDGIASTLNLRQRYSVAIDSRDNINDQWNPGELHCYTDGSKQSANTGFGVGIFLNGRVIATHAQYTGVNSSVFQNEVLAISSCTAELLATGVTAWIRTQHRSTWANRTNCRQSRGAVPQPSHQLRKLLLRLSRRDIRAATMTLSGHGCFSRHQYLQGNATNATCSFCNSGDETAEHFVSICPAFTRARLTYLGPHTSITEALHRNGSSSFNGCGSFSGALTSGKIACSGLGQPAGSPTSALSAAVLANADDAKLTALLTGRDEFGDTALTREIEACEDGNNFSVSLGILRCLLAKRWPLRPRLWREALLAGARSGRACLLQVLQDQDPEAWTTALLRCTDDEDGVHPDDNDSVLHCAAAGGHPGLLVSLARSVRAAGGDVFSVDSDGRTFADVLADRHRRLLPDLWTFEPSPATAADDFRRLLELVDPPLTPMLQTNSPQTEARALDCLASAAWQVKRLASRRDGENPRDRAERARQAVRLCAQADNCEQLVASLATLRRLSPADIDEDFLRELTLAGWCSAVRPLLLLVHSRPIECCFGVAEACHDALRRLAGGADSIGEGRLANRCLKRLRAWCLTRARSDADSPAHAALTDLRRRAETVACAALDRVWSVALADDAGRNSGATDDADTWQARVQRHFFEGRQPRLRPWRVEFDALSGTECARAYTERVWSQSSVNFAEPPTSLKQLPKVLLPEGASPRLKLLGQCLSVALLSFLLLLLLVKQSVAISTPLYAFAWLCFLCQVGQEAQEFVRLRFHQSRLPQLHPVLTACWMLGAMATVLGLSMRPLGPLAAFGRAALGVSLPLWLVGLVHRAAACQPVGCFILQAALVLTDDLLSAAVTLLPLVATLAFAASEAAKETSTTKPAGLPTMANQTDSLADATAASETSPAASSNMGWQIGKSSAFRRRLPTCRLTEANFAKRNLQLALAAIGLIFITALLAGRVSLTLKRRGAQIRRWQLRHRLGTALRLRDAVGPLPAPLNLAYAGVFVWRLVANRRMVRLRRGTGRHRDASCGSNGLDLQAGRGSGNGSGSSGGGGVAGTLGTLGRRSRPSESDARATQCMYQSSHAGVTCDAEDGSSNPLLMSSSSGGAASCAHRELRQYQLFQAGALRGFRARLAELRPEPCQQVARMEFLPQPSLMHY